MNNLLVGPVALPLAAALVTVVWPRRGAWIGASASLALVASVAYLLWRVSGEGAMTLAIGGWTPGLGIALHADPLALALLLMTALVAFATGLFATRYFANPVHQARFWPLWLLLLTALNALFLAADLFNLYVTLELLGISAVALAALGGSASAVRAALRYLMVGLLGSILFLAGIVLVYARYGTLELLALGGLLESEPAAWVALASISAGLVIKCALFPLHFWLPPAHANAPAPVSAALSALVVKGAFYLILRFWLELFQPIATPHAAWLLGSLGAGAVLWGSWHALCAPRLKLLAAYSTVAQLGYLFLFFPLLFALPPGPAQDTAFGALLLFAITHGFAKSALFLASGVVQQHVGHDRIAELGGCAQWLPITTFTLALSGIALIGLPPSGTFLAKWALLATAVSLGQWLWVAVVAVGTLLAAGYVVRVLGCAFAPGVRDRLPVDLGREALPALLLALTATVALGLGAAYVFGFIVPDALTSEAAA